LLTLNYLDKTVGKDNYLLFWLLITEALKM
jgi:hypothetical protein